MDLGSFRDSRKTLEQWLEQFDNFADRLCDLWDLPKPVHTVAPDQWLPLAGQSSNELEKNSELVYDLPDHDAKNLVPR